MNKKLLIAGFFATIMLIVPLSSVTGASVKGLDTTRENVAEFYPVTPDNMFDRLIVLFNFVLVNYGDNPEVFELCNEALEIVNFLQNNEPSKVYCLMLEGLMLIMLLIMLYFDQSDNLLLFLLFAALATAIGIHGENVGCWELPFLTEVEIDFNLQSTLDAIIANSATTEVSICPCSQSANI